MRDFEILEAFPFGITFSWEKDGEPNQSVLFERNGPIPSVKMLTFMRCAPFLTIVALLLWTWIFNRT